jgi:hypothetical protein
MSEDRRSKSACAQTSAESTDTALVIPHTHWESAVFKTREEYLELGLPHILKALTMLKAYPEYRFVLGQMGYVRPFLDRYRLKWLPSENSWPRARLRSPAARTRCTTTTCRPESPFRANNLLSKSYYRDRLGYDVTTGWALDTFGHNPQMPRF